MLRKSSKNSGFTLIELLAAIAIMLIMLGLGLVNYLEFRDKQRITQSKNTIRQAVADAQHAARSGRLFNCDQLAYYQLDFANDSDFGTVTLRAICAVGDNDRQKEYQLSREVRFSPIPPRLFVYPINGIIDEDTNIYEQSADDFELTIQLGNVEEDICINKTGTVKDGGC